MSPKNLSVTKKIPKLLISKLKNKKINTIYKKFENSFNINENFIVAVSGGPDSLALAFLAKIYSIKKSLTSKFLIVDHKLRPESTKEARTVKKILGKNLINTKILTWKGNKPIKNIQSLARKKRYELLFAESDKLKIDNILLGHHRNDLIENFFIRMLRGSGLRGLVSLDKKVKLGKKNLLRPLMDYKKEDLIFVAKLVFDFYVEDPTNKDENFKRIKIRKLIKDLKRLNIDIIQFPIDKKNPFLILRNIFKLKKIFEKEKIDLIHVRSRGPAWSAIYAAKYLNIPILTTWHGHVNQTSWFKKKYNSIMHRGDALIANSK